MIQPAAYLYLESRRYLRKCQPSWIVQNWGNDIQFFGPLKDHRDRIREILATCDYYDCECHRDVGLARQYGFVGQVLNVLPVSGGYDVEQCQAMRQPGKTSSRRVIAVKGYEGVFGRAFTTLRAIEMAAKVLKGFSIEVYLARTGVPEAAEFLSLRTGIPVSIVPPSPHEEIMRLHGRARVSIGISVSDGISQSLLEAMVMGSFPIQSNTAAAGEWVTDGKSGFVVPAEDVQAISAAIERAVTEDALVDEAAETNLRVAHERLDLAVTIPEIMGKYAQVLEERRLGGR
jgi:glycosyltransferase involved in cell wall biosynthesis